MHEVRVHIVELVQVLRALDHHLIVLLDKAIIINIILKKSILNTLNIVARLENDV